MTPNYLFGATSMLGWSLATPWRDVAVRQRRLTPFCNPYINLPEHSTWPRLKLEDQHALSRLFSEHPPPQLLLHCGGVCDVEQCEKNPAWAWILNVESMELLLTFLPPETRLVYCSSDHVFGGCPTPYDENSEPEPISEYGRTRVAAEKLVLEREGSLVVRSGLGIGPSPDGRTGHLDWLRYRTQNGLPTTLVTDEYRSTVWSNDLAHRVWDLAQSHETGLRHVPATRCVSRIELAKHLDAYYELGAQLHEVTAAERDVPHLGRVELASQFTDEFSEPLPSPLDVSPA
jgi:dTDP-4-dehydrorhamnose reductase